MQHNRYRGGGLNIDALADIPDPAATPRHPELFAQLGTSRPTPLSLSPRLARAARVAEVWVKDERGRFGLGSFKALGAAYAIACEAADPGAQIAERVYVTASAGNHGLSVAYGAKVFGAKSVIYLADTVPEAFVALLQAHGATVTRAGAAYADAMSAAEQAAEANGWTLLSDSSWPGYTHLPHRVMEGYTRLAQEAAAQFRLPPTHILLQAGVGGLAAAIARAARANWGQGPKIIVVEPTAAPAIHDSLKAGQVLETSGPDSTMGRLDCKTPSLIALKGLAEDADGCVLISDDTVAAHLPTLEAAGFATSPSGGAALAAMLAGLCDLPPHARVWAILSEGPV